MTPTEADILRASLEKTSNAFFRRLAAKKTKIVTANGDAAGYKVEVPALLAVISGWVGDLIAGAPEHMRDNLFLGFADAAAEVAGIKEDEPEEPLRMETLQ